MSFLLDPFLAFMLGILFSFLTKMFNTDKAKTFAICGIAISLATLYSILLYLDVVKTDFLILDTFSRILPIEQQIGPRIMFHSNFSGVTSESFPVAIVVIFYALYFLWFYLGFRSFRNITAPLEPTPKGNPSTALYMRVGGLLVFASAGMMLFFFTMIPLDKVAIGEWVGAKASPELQNEEAVVRGYMGMTQAKFVSFSDSLCNPDKIGLESRPQTIVGRDSSIVVLINDLAGLTPGGMPASSSSSSLPSQSLVTISDVRDMCNVRETAGANILFVFVNISTWLFLIAFFMVSTTPILRATYWNYGNKDRENKSPSSPLGGG